MWLWDRVFKAGGRAGAKVPRWTFICSRICKEANNMAGGLWQGASDEKSLERSQELDGQVEPCSPKGELGSFALTIWSVKGHQRKEEKTLLYRAMKSWEPAASRKKGRQCWPQNSVSEREQQRNLIIKTSAKKKLSGGYSGLSCNMVPWKGEAEQGRGSTGPKSYGLKFMSLVIHDMKCESHVCAYVCRYSFLELALEMLSFI